MNEKLPQESIKAGEKKKGKESIRRGKKVDAGGFEPMRVGLRNN